MLSPEFKVDEESGVYTFRLLEPYGRISDSLANITLGLDKASEALILKTVLLLDVVNRFRAEDTTYEPPLIAVDLSHLPKVKAQIVSPLDKHLLAGLDSETMAGIAKRPADKIVFLYFNLSADTSIWTLVDIPDEPQHL
jgi:hypothetical protein